MAKEFYWKTKDNLNIYGIEWEVENAQAVICFAHGIGEHMNRYHHLATYYNTKNIALIGNDHRGHGRSDGMRGHFQSYENYLDEIDQLISEAKHRYPNTPIILYGHSLGGNIVLNYLIKRRPTALSAAITTAPWIKLSFQPPFLIMKIGKLVRNLAPNFILPNSLNIHDLSKRPEVIEAYKNDPLIHRKVSSALGIDILEAGIALSKYKGDLPCPTLLMHGDADRITNHDATQEFASNCTTDVTFKSWKGLYHEIHNEFNYIEVFNFTHSWLKDKLAL